MRLKRSVGRASMSWRGAIVRQMKQNKTRIIGENLVRLAWLSQVYWLMGLGLAEELRLEAPDLLGGLPFAEAPNLQLVALNRRRFELEHSHAGLPTLGSDLARAQLIESQFAQLPDHLLGALSLEQQREQLQSLALSGPDEKVNMERLSKSCMTVHASSSSPDQLNVSFLLFTRANPHSAYLLRPETSRAQLLSGSPLRPRKPLKWITHGFHTNVDKSEWMLDAKDKILAHEDANVILTDWRRGASPALAFYPKAAANAHVVAKMIVQLLRRLRPELNLAQVHLIGHSLGAHIMGFVGSAFTEEYLMREQQLQLAKQESFWTPTTSATGYPFVGRITACDPALPCFGPTSSAPNGRSPDWTPSMWTHLRPDSAALVEVLHSNPGIMGYTDPLGDFDFYPNGLGAQPGCAGQPVEPFTGSSDRRQLWSSILGHLFARPAGLNSSMVSDKHTDLTHPRTASSGIDSILRPIKDFLHGSACSHHRAVELMVESMYADRPDHVHSSSLCQLVGYRCSDYATFKRGLCFRCNSELDCRIFAMGLAREPSLVQLARSVSVPVQPEPKSGPQIRKKRILPALDASLLGAIEYKQTPRNKYFLDTGATKDFCLHHYHLMLRCNWFQLRPNLRLESIQIMGEGANLTINQEITLHRLDFQNYALLLTHTHHLGSISSAKLIASSNLKPGLIQFAQITYMSNLDPNVRTFGSARLCPQLSFQFDTANLITCLDTSQNPPIKTLS